jgi:phosphotransferase family enzyme
MQKEETLGIALRSRIERLLGSKIESWRRVEGGYTPALRLLCQTAGGAFFVKIGSTPLTSQMLRREILNYSLIRGDFIPQLVGWEDDAVAPILIIEDLSAAFWPPSWDERKVELVLAQINAMHNAQAPLEPFAHAHPTFGPFWQIVASDPAPFLSLNFADERWLEAALPALVAAENACSTEGGSLTHWDLRSDNMCLTEGRAIFVDWNLACLSNPILDLGFWLPSLAYEGGPEPEMILPHAPEVAALVAGYFASRAGLPGISDAPRVRLVQRQQLSTALPWAVRALELPPLKQGQGIIVGE